MPGVVTGKQGGNSVYIPTIYSKSQNDWVENFYKQNGYLGKEYTSYRNFHESQNLDANLICMLLSFFQSTTRSQDSGYPIRRVS